MVEMVALLGDWTTVLTFELPSECDGVPATEASLKGDGYTVVAQELGFDAQMVIPRATLTANPRGLRRRVAWNALRQGTSVRASQVDGKWQVPVSHL